MNEENKLTIDPSLTDNAYQPIELQIKKGSIADKLGKLFKSNTPKNKKQNKEEVKIPLPPPPSIQQEMQKKMEEKIKAKEEVKEVAEDDLDKQIAELQRKKEEAMKEKVSKSELGLEMNEAMKELTYTYINVYEANVIALLTEIRDLLIK